MNSGQSLRDTFLNDSKVSWTDLGEATAGAIIFQVFTLLIAVPQGIAAAIDSFTTQIGTGLESGINQLSTTIAGESAAAWAPLNAGVFSVLLNLVVVLAAIFVATRGWRWLNG